MRFLIVFLAFFATGCGPSETEIRAERERVEAQKAAERDRAALVACAAIKETSLNDRATRVSLVNEARTAAQSAPFLDGDRMIVLAVKAGLCETLVLKGVDEKAIYDVLGIQMYREDSEKIIPEKIALEIKQYQDSMYIIENRASEKKDTVESITNFTKALEVVSDFIGLTYEHLAGIYGGFAEYGFSRDEINEFEPIISLILSESTDRISCIKEEIPQVQDQFYGPTSVILARKVDPRLYERMLQAAKSCSDSAAKP